MIRLLSFILLLCSCSVVYGSGFTLSLGNLSGTELGLRTLLHYEIYSSYPSEKTVRVQGQLRFRNTRHAVTYTADVVLRPGSNTMIGQPVRLQYSSTDLQRLLEAGAFPAGSYEYCVTVALPQRSQESQREEETQDCIFGNRDEQFLIELDYPEDGARIREYTPQLIWLVNSPLAGQLHYRIKVAEQQPKQSKLSALQRNNYVLDYKYHRMNALSYPATGRALLAGQWYVWTVDAYYNDILLGTAAPWRFIIVTDSVEKVLPFSRSYYDFAGSRQAVALQVSDTVKLKYEHTGGVVSIGYSIVQEDKDGERVIYSGELELHPGWNYKDLLLQRGKLRHKTAYQLRFRIGNNSYALPFRYHNIHKM